MGVIFGNDQWRGRLTRIYVRYDHPDPDWENDPDIADALQEIRGPNNIPLEGHEITLMTPQGCHDIVIARRPLRQDEPPREDLRD